MTTPRPNPLKQFGKDLSQLLSHSMQVHIITIFLFIMIITFGAIIGYSYQRNSTAVLNMGQEFLKISRQSVINKLQVFLRRAQLYTSFLAQLYNSSEEVNPGNLPIIDIMREILRNNTAYASIYTATLKGNFLQMLPADPTESYYENPNKKLPPETLYAVRFIDGESQQPSETWYYQNGAKRLLDTEKLPAITYRFQNRPWFVSVAESQRTEWSDLYIYSTNKKPGFTIACPVFHAAEDLMIGITGIDIDASQLGELLKEDRITQSCSSIIFNGKMEVIASSDMLETVRVEGDKVLTPLITQFPDQKIVEAYNIYEKTKQPVFNFIFQDREYIAYFDDFPTIETINEQGKIEKADVFNTWKIGVVVPTQEFVGSIENVQKKILLIALGLLILATIIMTYIIRRISKPIVMLAEEAKKIKNFELESNQEVKTSVLELQQLNDSIVSMRQSMRSFSKFIPKVLVGKLLKSQGEVRIGGHQRKITLAFTDVASFTTVCEGYPADKLALHLSEYFEEVSQIIMQNNGTIDKYIGDAVMSFWGAPIHDKEQGLNACKAALYLQKRLGDLNRKWEAEHKPLLLTRIGIHTGEVIVGNIGSSDRMNYTALGDSVNLASRLEGTNKLYNTNIIISEEVYKEIGDNCLVRPIDIVAVKGKNEGVKIYELVSLLKGDPALLPSQEQIKFCEAFTKGFRLYLEQRWDEAIGVFSEMEETFGSAYTTNLYIKRCKGFKKAPPPADWNGVIHLSEK